MNDVILPVLGEAGPWMFLIGLAYAWHKWMERRDG